VSLSSFDDFPVHQIADVVRHVGTSDRNFYDRYYFNLHPSADDLFAVIGMGQYPNLGVTDAFVTVVHDGVHRVVRASRELGPDRLDTRIGPISVEVLEGLKRLRVVLEPNEWDVSLDITFEGAEPAHLEPRHFHRQFERVLIDSCRLAQTGWWSGRLSVAGHDFEVTPDHWWGSRDRSWGVRPVGEPEPPGIRGTESPEGFFWLYVPMQFPGFSLFFSTQERQDGTRVLEEATRVWTDGRAEHLGRPEHDIEFVPGTRRAARARLRLGDVEVEATPVLPLEITKGAGYGLDPDWRHGSWQGPLKVEGRSWDLSDPANQPSVFSVVDNLARFECDGQTGWGLFEFAAIGPHDGYGFKGWDDVAG
jgi:hypothetical protein